MPRSWRPAIIRIILARGLGTRRAGFGLGFGTFNQIPSITSRARSHATPIKLPKFQKY